MPPALPAPSASEAAPASVGVDATKRPQPKPGAQGRVFEMSSSKAVVQRAMRPGIAFALKAFAMHWHGVRAYRLAHRLSENGWPELAQLVDAFSRAFLRIDIDHESIIGEDMSLMHGGIGIVVGRSIIGDRVRIFPGAVIGTRDTEILRAATIEDDVWIGAGSKVLGAITIGHHAVIGANAVVLDDVPPGAHVAGVPSRIVGWSEGFGPSVQLHPRGHATDRRNRTSQ